MRAVRALGALARVLFFFAPLLILGVWGAFYLRECFQLLAAPGAGVDFNYRARGGVLHITADSYNWRVRSGELFVARPRLREPGGELLASAASAHISGIRLWGEPQPIEANLRELKASLVRLQNGKFALEDYLPEITPEAEPRAFRATVNDAEVLYLDYSGKTPYRQQANFPRLEVEGVGDNWVASGPIELPTIGKALAAVQRHKDMGLLVALDANRLNLSRVFSHFRTTPEGKRIELLRDMSLETLVAEGPIRLHLPSERPYNLSADLKARATGIVIEDTNRFEWAEFEGLATGDGARGHVRMAQPGASAEFEGSATWTGQARMGGSLIASAANKQSVPATLRRLLPPDLAFSNLKAKGWLAFEPKAGWRFAGNIRTDRTAYAGETVSRLDGEMRLSDESLRLTNATGVWNTIPLDGTVAYRFDNGQVSGLVAGKDVPLRTLANRFQIGQLAGVADVQALIGGTSANPAIQFRASGDLAYARAGHTEPLSGDFVAAGGFDGKTIGITSFTLDSQTGTLVAAGTADPSGRLNLRVAANDIPLAALSPDVSGRGTFVGTLTGTTGAPRLEGRAQITDFLAGGQTVPLAIANLSADRGGLKATNVRAVRGAAVVGGELAYRFENGRLEGAFAAGSVPLFPFDERLGGSIDVANAVLGGTLAQPVFSADIASKSLDVAGRHVENLKGKLKLKGDEFSISEARATLAGGNLVATATGNTKTGRTKIELTGQGLSLADLMPELQDAATVEGTVTGLATLGLKGAILTDARARGSLDDVEINETLVGSGTWSTVLSPSTLSGTLQIGTLERYLELTKFSYDRKLDLLDTSLVAYRIPIQDLTGALDRYLPVAATDLERRLRRFEGVFDASATIVGPARQPNVDLSLLDVSDLSLEGRSFGRFTTSLERNGSFWRLKNLSLTGDAGTFQASGTLDEKGQTALGGDLTNFDLSILSLFNDNFAKVRGRAGLAFDLSGPTRSPVLQASLEARNTKIVADSQGEQESLVDFGLVLDTVRISETERLPTGALSGGLEASGRLFYQGLEGNLLAQLPVKYPFTMPEGLPLSVSLDLPQRELQSLSAYFPKIDETRTQGTVEGRLALGGVIGAVVLSGRVAASAKQFALDSVQNTLNDATAEATVGNGQAALLIQGTSSAGGTVNATASSTIGDAMDRIDEIAGRGLDALLDRGIVGEIGFDAFGIRYENKEIDGRAIAKTDGKIAISGTMRSPLLAGNLALSGTDVRLPGWEVVAGGPPRLRVDPRFDIGLRLIETGRFSTGVARLDIDGSGHLGGSLSEPDVEGDFVVQSGSVNLPTARIRVLPGGTANLRFNVDDAGQALSRLDVFLEGQTSLTALEYGDLPQRYEIALTIRGNLLEQDGAIITAESDPPGLSQQRILALIGQTDLIAGILGGLSRLETEERLRNVLAGYAIPALFEPITGAFARGLGLEYLNLEYALNSQVSVSFAKALGPNLVLYGRRQISEPIPGTKLEYDVRLAYRLPFVGKALRRLSLSAGLDQDRPWKIALEYGFRF